MFSSITQRLLWKEFRAQQLVWIAIAGELVLLQLWWGFRGHEYAELNLFSMAFVLTGVFAMTTSALLFAGESEAKTDLFLRQLPITPRQLIGGKLLYGGLALVAFLVFALLSTLIAGQMAGKYGGESSSMMGDPSVFGLSIIGLAAWGLFYSLLTRKVLWTVIGAALTEIIIGGIVHSVILSEYHFPEYVFYAIYAVIIAGVVAVDAWLLTKWCTSESQASVETLLGAETAPGVTTPAKALPWHAAFRWSWITGIASGFFTAVILLFVAYIQSSSIANTPITPSLAMGTVMGLLATALLRWDRSRGKPVATRSSWRLGELRHMSLGVLALVGQSLYAWILGLVVSGSLFALLFSLVTPNVDRRGEAVALSLFFALASTAAIWWRDDRLRSGSMGWLRPLQWVHGVRNRSVRRIGPLLWIEIRRARLVLFIGVVLLVLIGQYRPEMQDAAVLSYFAIVIAALVCGLLTLLPDRSHGTLAFLAERGVSSTTVLGSKVFVWGSTLLCLLIPPLLQGRVWKELSHPYQPIPQVTDGLLWQGMAERDIHWIPAPSPASYLFVLLLGTFTIGVLAAAWVRRPILAGIVGFSLMLPWFGWCMMLMETYAPVGITAVVPIVLIGLGILGTGSRTLLEQSSWRSKFGQIVWVLFVGFIGLQGYFHFRANEIPYLYDELAEIRNGQPSPLSNSVSSWMYPFDESISHAAQLDALVDDEAKRNSLVQPLGLWGAPSSLQMGIESLKLEEETCDLDAAFEHLRKWHQLTEHLAFASRNEEGWVDALVGRRVVLSAIRQWANHPQQTAERLEAAMTKLKPNQIGMSGATVIARQYADARRSLETGINSDSIYPSVVHQVSPGVQWLLARTGEKERVRRLIDYYFYLSAGSQASQLSSAGEEFDYWVGTTRASAASLGVNLPWARFQARYHGQFELALSAETATRLVLRLQAWRLKHGSFPASFAEVIDQTGPIHIYDNLANATFHYEPHGFDRDLLVESHTLIPAKQPLLYSEGLTEPRGVELVQQNPVGEMSQPSQYRARNFNTLADWSRRDQPILSRPANPLTIRFSVFGQVTDEDSLYRLQRAGQPEEPRQDAGAAVMGGSAMGSGMLGEAPPTALPTSEAPLPQAETPEP